MVAFQHRFGLLTGSVRAGAGFGQTESAQLFAFCQRNQIFLLLFRRTEFVDRFCAQRGVRGNDNTGGAANTAQFFYADCIGQRIAALATHFLGKRNAHEAVFLHFLDGFNGEVLGFVHFLRQGFYLCFSKLPKQAACHFLFFAEYEVHTRSS